MGLLAIDDVVPLLVCPRCRAPLSGDAAELRCDRKECALSSGEPFPRVDGRPVLVDFERSILVREEVLATAAASPVARLGGASRVEERLRRLVTPPTDSTLRNVERMRRLLHGLAERPTLLVVGGGSVGADAERLYEDPSIGVVALDIYSSPLTQLVADGHQIPLADASVDGVLIQAVLEHVLDPGKVVGEIHRVLRPRGIVYSETPFLQQVHEGPYDFTRFTESGNRYLFRRFSLIDSGVAGGPGTQLLWTLEHTVRSLTRSVVAGKVARALLFWLRFLDGLVPPTYAVDAACGVYFLGRRAHRGIGPRDIVRHYRGAQRPGGRRRPSP